MVETLQNTKNYLNTFDDGIYEIGSSPQQLRKIERVSTVNIVIKKENCKILDFDDDDIYDIDPVITNHTVVEKPEPIKILEPIEPQKHLESSTQNINEINFEEFQSNWTEENIQSSQLISMEITNQSQNIQEQIACLQQIPDQYNNENLFEMPMELVQMSFETFNSFPITEEIVVDSFLDRNQQLMNENPFAMQQNQSSIFWENQSISLSQQDSIILQNGNHFTKLTSRLFQTPLSPPPLLSMNQEEEEELDENKEENTSSSSSSSSSPHSEIELTSPPPQKKIKKPKKMTKKQKAKLAETKNLINEFLGDENSNDMEFEKSASLKKEQDDKIINLMNLISIKYKRSEKPKISKDNVNFVLVSCGSKKYREKYRFKNLEAIDNLKEGQVPIWGFRNVDKSFEKSKNSKKQDKSEKSKKFKGFEER